MSASYPPTGPATPVATRSAPARLLIAAGAVGAAGTFLACLDSDTPAAERMAVCLVVAVACAAALRAVASVSNGWRALGALLLGTVATATGVGTGLVHLPRGFLTPAVVIGSITFVAGAVLLLGGTVALVRWLRGPWKLLVIPALLVLGQLLLIPLATAVAATHAPRMPVTVAPPAGARDVEVVTPDGATLAAWYVPSRTGAAVVLLHGAGGSRGDSAAQAAVLARRGYGVLALDARGRGDSDGRDMQLGWWGVLDVAGAVDFLAAQPDVDPARIGAVGLSMGAEQALTAAAVDPRLRAVVAAGASGRTGADYEFLPSDSAGLITRANSILGTVVADLLSAAPVPGPLPDAVARLADRPVLLIAGTDPVERAANEAFVERTGGRAQLWLPAGISHVAELARLPAEWEWRVAAFLDASL